MEPREGYHVDCKFSQVSIELTWEAKTGCHTGHGQRYQMVEIAIGGVDKLKGPEANVVKGLIVNSISLISIFHQLMNRECCIVGLNNSVRYFWGGDYRVGVHDSIRVFFTDLGDEESSETRPSASTKRVGQLKSL